MADEWKEELLCPKCRKTGMVSLYQRRDFEPPTVESLPHGFKIVDTHFGSVFYCEDCDIEVMP
jgi:hypothetical protein